MWRKKEKIILVGCGFFGYLEIFKYGYLKDWVFLLRVSDYREDFNLLCIGSWNFLLV